MQPGLVFTRHVDRVKRKAIAAIAMMTGNLRKISLQSALRIFDSKVKPIASYGLHLISPYLKSSHMTELDIIKNRFLKKTLSLPMWTGNELVYKLCETTRFCQELAEKGYRFEENNYLAYLREVEESKNREKVRKRNSLAFEDLEWKGIQQPRHYFLGYTAHGFHFRLCTDQSFHDDIKSRCRCKFCAMPITEVDHLVRCTALSGSLFERYRAVYE